MKYCYKIAILLFLISFCSANTQYKALKVVEKIFTPTLSSEGAGAKVRRIIGSPEIRRLDPFLMLDLFSARLPGGFPDHPHRGFDTVTYMLQGKILHEDFKGNKGSLGPGDLQWMTAGKGILHAEMPASWDEDSIGFQLWLNLAEKDKFCDPEYQEIPNDNVPKVVKDKVTVKVIAGESLGVQGPIRTRTPAMYLDVQLEPMAIFEQVIPRGWNAIAFVYSGKVYVGDDRKKVETNSVVLLKNDQNDILEIETDIEGAKLIIIAGKPLDEPVVSHGPFVLSNRQQLEQTFQDFRRGENGFEAAVGWRSEIKNLAKK